MNAIFIDRDGTIIEEVNYLSSFEQIKIYQFAYSAIKILKDYGYKIFLITNQSGVARGYFLESFVIEVNSYLCKKLNIDYFLYCPHLPEHNCNCRKPKTGLIKKVLEKYPDIKLKNSYFIGDKETDIETGLNCNMKTILIGTGYGKNYFNTTKADFIVKNIYYASLLISNLT